MTTAIYLMTLFVTANLILLAIGLVALVVAFRCGIEIIWEAMR